MQTSPAKAANEIAWRFETIETEAGIAQSPDALAVALFVEIDGIRHLIDDLRTTPRADARVLHAFADSAETLVDDIERIMTHGASQEENDAVMARIADHADFHQAVA